MVNSSENQKPTNPDKYAEVKNPNWQDNIQYFFRPFDISSMKSRDFHLDNYAFVSDHVDQILNRVKGIGGTRMPLDGPYWSNARINTLNNWKKTGKPEISSVYP